MKLSIVAMPKSEPLHFGFLLDNMIPNNAQSHNLLGAIFEFVNNLDIRFVLDKVSLSYRHHISSFCQMLSDTTLGLVDVFDNRLESLKLLPNDIHYISIKRLPNDIHHIIIVPNLGDNHILEFEGSSIGSSIIFFFL